MTTAADVLKLIKEKEVKFVDLRFTDTKGKEQHVTVPTRVVDEAFFEDGKGFDGSSIAGWKGIQESDMILMPDPTTAILDPFFEETTLNLRCDIVEPSTMQGYERDPRSLAKRAEAYLKSTGIADASMWGPENEFFIFDSVRHGSSMNGCFYEVDSLQGAWNSRQPASTAATSATARASRAATSRCRRWTPTRTCAPPCASRWRRWASRSRCTTPRSPPAARPRSTCPPTRW